jgi:hypothetical protein
MQLLLNLLLLLYSPLLCCSSAENSIHLPMYAADYSIAESELMKITGAEYRAYENAWSVSFDVLAINSIIVFALCREPCPPVSSEYRLFECLPMLATLGEPQWHNEYMSAHAADGEVLCNAMRASPADVQLAVDQILSDSAGGALVRLRHPNTMVIFYEEEVVLNWMTIMGDEFGLTFRATQVEVVGQHFGLRHYKDHVLLLNSTQHFNFVRGGLTFALRNGCTAVGFAAPEFGNVHSVSEAGRLRCVWACREDMIRQPYNSAPPTVEQLNTSSPEHALLPVKYACVPLPKVWVASVFGFTVDTTVSPSDVGYEQALFDAVDNLSQLVKMELAAAGLDGIMVFSVKNSVYHTSFADRLSELQQAACAIANAPDDKCREASSALRNPDYVYRRRLLSSSQAEIEGLFISGDERVFAEPNKREEHLTLLRTSLVRAIVEHAPVLGGLQNAENIDFSQVVAFATPVIQDTTTPPPTEPSNSEASVGQLLVLIGSVLGAVCVFALCFVARS